MTKIMEQMNQKRRGISRRDFLKSSLAATSAVAGLSLISGCQGNVSETAAPDTTGTTDTAPQSSTAPRESEAATEAAAQHPEITDICEGGEWLPAACWLN